MKLKQFFALPVILGSLTGCMATTMNMPEANAKYRPSRGAVMSMVATEARRMGFPASLALAVAHTESNFNSRARSSKGARGVMQIMPRTAMGEYGIKSGQLWNPRINIRVGIHFLGRLIERYGGKIDIALSHYNGGSAVGRPGRAKVIPATRPYIKRVRRLNRHYRRVLATQQISTQRHMSNFNRKG